MPFGTMARGIITNNSLTSSPWNQADSSNNNNNVSEITNGYITSGISKVGIYLQSRTFNSNNEYKRLGFLAGTTINVYAR